MTRLLSLSLTALVASACSLAGDYDRPYDQRYRPIDDPVVNPFVLPSEEPGAADAGPSADTPEALLRGTACHQVEIAWPTSALHCLLVCQEGRRLADCGEDTPPATFSDMLEGICIHICEGVNRQSARRHPTEYRRRIDPGGLRLRIPAGPSIVCTTGGKHPCETYRRQ